MTTDHWLDRTTIDISARNGHRRTAPTVPCNAKLLQLSDRTNEACASNSIHR